MVERIIRRRAHVVIWSGVTSITPAMEDGRELMPCLIELHLVRLKVSRGIVLHRGCVKKAGLWFELAVVVSRAAVEVA